MQLIRTWFGIFTVENDNIISCDLYPKDVHTLAERLQETPLALSTSEVCCRDLRTLAEDWGFINSNQEYDNLFHDVNIEYTRRQVTAAKSDEHILIHAIEAMDDLDRINNALSERLNELYGINFPELGLKSEPLARFISKYGPRKNPGKWDVEDDTILLKASNSMGVELPESIAENLTDMAGNIAGLFENRDRLSKYIEDYMNSTYPNLSAVAGAHIGARLISIAGSVRKLVNMPSGTIQVLGAEKAMFKHLKGSAPSPKHGVIFQHPFINTAPGWLKGRIARLLASRISRAVRVDYFSGEYKREIVKDLNQRVEDLYKKYPEPPRRR